MLHLKPNLTELNQAGWMKGHLNVSSMTSHTETKVLTPDGITEAFRIIAGVLQGDTLAPYLFIIVLGYALREAIDKKLPLNLDDHQNISS